MPGTDPSRDSQAPLTTHAGSGLRGVSPYLVMHTPLHLGPVVIEVSDVMMTVFAAASPPERQSLTVTRTMLTPVIIRLKETGEARTDTHHHHPLQVIHWQEWTSLNRTWITLAK